MAQTPAQQAHPRAGTEEFSFVALPAHARPAAMAGTFTASAKGPAAVGINPAGLAAPGSGSGAPRRVAGSVKLGAVDDHFGGIGYSFPLDSTWQAALSIGYLHFGTIFETDETGSRTGNEIVPSAASPAVSIARTLWGHWKAGGTVQLATEYLGDFEGSRMALGWGLDAGLIYQPDSRLATFGLSALHAGRKIRAHVAHGESGGLLPLELRMGAVYHALAGGRGSLALDLAAPYHNHPYGALGVEFWLNRVLALRAGSRANFPELLEMWREFVLGRSDLTFTGQNAMKLTAGFGISQGKLGVDYAAQYWHGLGVVHYLTLSL